MSVLVINDTVHFCVHRMLCLVIIILLALTEHSYVFFKPDPVSFYDDLINKKKFI